MNSSCTLISLAPITIEHRLGASTTDIFLTFLQVWFPVGRHLLAGGWPPSPCVLLGSSYRDTNPIRLGGWGLPWRPPWSLVTFSNAPFPNTLTFSVNSFGVWSVRGLHLLTTSSMGVPGLPSHVLSAVMLKYGQTRTAVLAVTCLLLSSQGLHPHRVL